MDIQEITHITEHPQDSQLKPNKPYLVIILS